jgi:hypothetical protein
MGGINHQNMGGFLLLYIYVTLIRCVAAYVQVNHRHFWVGNLLISGHPINQQRRLCDVPSILKTTNQQIVTYHVCLGIYIIYIYRGVSENRIHTLNTFSPMFKPTHMMDVSRKDCNLTNFPKEIQVPDMPCPLDTALNGLSDAIGLIYPDHIISIHILSSLILF